MSLEVHIFATEKEANDFLEPFMQKNQEILQQLEQPKKVLPFEVVCPFVLYADKNGYSFYGGVKDPMEMMNMDYSTPTTLAEGVREALVEYINYLPRVQLCPLFLTIQEISSLTPDDALERAKKFIGSLPQELRDTLYAEVSDEISLRELVEDSLSSRGLNKSEVQEFQQEYQKVPKGLN